MPVPIIIAAAIVAALVLLIIGYRRARRSPLFADSVAFPMILVVRPAVMLQRLLEKVATYCGLVVEKSLRYPAGVIGDTFHGVLVISRTIILAVSLIILTADIYNMLQRLPLLFGGAGAVDLPGSFAIPSALLFVAMSALYGATVLECVDLLPYGAGLFPKMTEKVKKWLGIACSIGFGLSVVFAVLFWVTSAYYISVDPSTPAWLAIPALALAAIILTGASVLALWGLVVGFLGLISFVFWLLECVFHILAGVVKTVLSPADVFVRYITHGRWSIYMDLLGHDPHKPPASPFPQGDIVSPGQPSTELVPQSASTIVDAEAEDIVVAANNTTPMEVEMSNNPDKAASFVHAGSFGSCMFPHNKQKIRELRASGSILSSAFFDLSINHIHTTIDGIADLSPTRIERHNAVIHSDTEWGAYHALFNQFSDKGVALHLGTKDAPALLYFFIDCRLLVEAVEMLERFKHRLPLHPIIVVTEVSASDLSDAVVVTGLSDMQALASEDIIATVVVLDPHSNFASRHGGETQRAFVAQPMTSLVIGHKHSLQNKSGVQLSHEFSSPFMSISAASEPVALGTLPNRFKWIPGASGHAGVGDYGDILAQTKTAIDRAFNGGDCCMFGDLVATDSGSLVVVNVPIRLDDVRFSSIVRDTSLYVSSHHNSTSVTVRGNGIAYPHHLGSRLLVQASILHALQPASLFRLQDDKKSVKITPLYPFTPSTTAVEPVNSNGTGSAKEQQKALKQTKAVTSRQKKAAPGRRVVVGKSNKQAK